MAESPQSPESLAEEDLPPKKGGMDPAECSGSNLEKLLESKWEELEKDALDLLQKLIRIDTQNFGDEGTEIQAVSLLEGVFKDAGIPYEVVEPRPGRGNIVARLSAAEGKDSSGESKKKGPLLLNSHLDTVKAPREGWKEVGWAHDPFGGDIDEEDGCLYGRGAVDMKNMAAMAVSILCFVKRSGIALERDLVFAGVADEERGDSAYGIKHLVEHRPELVQCDVVLSEVGGFSYFLDGKEGFLVQIAEKGNTKLKITAHGSGGHGSFYHKDNPIANIGEVAHRLSNNKLPLRVVPANQVTIDSMSSVLPFPKSMVMRRLLSPSFSSFIVNRILPSDQREPLSAILSNTANPVTIGGGEQFNQVPTSAWVGVDCRVLPGCTSQDVIQDVKQLLGPSRFQPSTTDEGAGTGETDTTALQPELTIQVLSERPGCCQDMSTPECVEVLDVIRSVVAKRAEGAPIVTNMIPGGTDLLYYSKLPAKPVCLGFSPVRLPPELNFSKLFHGQVAGTIKMGLE